MPRSAREELEGLLESSETDNEAETLSLHSDIDGQRKDKNRRVRRKKRRFGKKKVVTVFGYNLFGKPLVDSDAEDDANENDAGPSSSRNTTHTRNEFGIESTSTLDSDAAPVADAEIANLSLRWDPPQTEEELAREEEEQRLREEQRDKKRERRELKKAAAALAAGIDEDEFEGYPGSGSYAPSHHAPARQLFQTDAGEEFGPFTQANHTIPPTNVHDEADGDAADFGAESYIRKAGSVRSGSRSGSNSSSSARGRRSPAPHSPSPLAAVSQDRIKSSTSQTASSPSLASPRLSPSIPAAIEIVTSPSPPPTSNFSDYPRIRFGNVTEPATGKPTSPIGFPSTGFPSSGLSRPSGGLSRATSASSFRDALGQRSDD